MLQAITLKKRSSACIYLILVLLLLVILAPRPSFAQSNLCPEVLIVNEVMPGPIGYIIENEQYQIVATAPLGEKPPTCNLLVGERYRLLPFRPGKDMKLVTTFDLITTSRFLMGIGNSDFTFGRRHAADINESSTISMSDIQMLKNHILHPYKELTQTDTWSFFPEDVADLAPTMPFKIEHMYFTYTGPGQQLNYKSVKAGRSRVESKYYDTNFPRVGTLFFDVMDNYLVKGQSYTISVLTNDFTNIIGYQLALQLDPQGLELIEWLPGLHAPLPDVGLDQPIKGLVTTLYMNDLEPAENQSLPNGQILFSLKVKARATGKLSKFLRLNREAMLSEAYNRDDEFLDTELRFIGLSSVNNDVIAQIDLPGFPFYEGPGAALRNQASEEGATPLFMPNPFRDEVQVNFWQDQAGETIIRITDLMGRDVVVQQRFYAAGHHQWAWHAGNHLPPGHYIASVIQEGEVHTTPLLKL